jgi:hypothetical protein
MGLAKLNGGSQSGRDKINAAIAEAENLRREVDALKEAELKRKGAGSFQFGFAQDGFYTIYQIDGAKMVSKEAI